MLKKTIYILAVIMLMASCKAKKGATTNTSTKGLSTKKVIKNHYKNTFGKETITAKMKVKYRGKNSLPSVNASLRMEKDKTIWISLSKLGFLRIGKVLITKNNVSYYNNIDKTYFEGDFKFLSDWLGTELDFEKIQNLLLGEAILDLNKSKYQIVSSEPDYLIVPKKQNDLYDILFSINNSHYKLTKQEVSQPEKNKNLAINYYDYKNIDGETFPKALQIKTFDGKYESTVDVEYRTIEFNKSVSFPFSIPDGYKEIKLK